MHLKMIIHPEAILTNPERGFIFAMGEPIYTIEQ